MADDEVALWVIRCGDGAIHAEHGKVPTAATEQCARDAAEFMDDERADSPWTCGPHSAHQMPPNVTPSAPEPS